MCVCNKILNSLVCSAKFFDDQVFKNSQWASIGGVGLSELSRLEREFLQLLDYQLFVTHDAYVQVFFTTIIYLFINIYTPSNPCIIIIKIGIQ